MQYNFAQGSTTFCLTYGISPCTYIPPNIPGRTFVTIAFFANLSAQVNTLKPGFTNMKKPGQFVSIQVYIMLLRSMHTILLREANLLS